MHLAVCVDPEPAQGDGLGRATQPETAAYSAVLAVHTLWLAARAEGVGVGWVSILEPEAVLAGAGRAGGTGGWWPICAWAGRGTQSDMPELERDGWETRAAAEVLRR